MTPNGGGGGPNARAGCEAETPHHGPGVEHHRVHLRQRKPGPPRCVRADQLLRARHDPAAGGIPVGYPPGHCVPLVGRARADVGIGRGEGQPAAGTRAVLLPHGFEEAEAGGACARAKRRAQTRARASALTQVLVEDGGRKRAEAAKHTCNVCV